MARIDIALHQVIKLRLTPEGPVHPARVLAQDAESWLLEVEGLAVSAGPVTIDFVAQSFFLRATVPVEGALRGWWIVERPDEAACVPVQRRNFPRIFFDAAAVVLPLGPAGEPDGELTTLQIANLSADGCFAFTDADMQPGDTLVVYLTLGQLPTTPVTARVVRARREEVGGWYGLRFETLPPGYQEQLAQLIEDEIASHKAQGRDITSPVG